MGLLDDCPQPGRCIRFGWQVPGYPHPAHSLYDTAVATVILVPPLHGGQIDMFAGFSGATPNLWAMAGLVMGRRVIKTRLIIFCTENH
jgi:hypothetical protein